MNKLMDSHIEPATREMLSFEQVQALVNLNSSTLLCFLESHQNEIRTCQRAMDIFYHRQDVLASLRYLMSE